jgi:hypothetical protein
MLALILTNGHVGGSRLYIVIIIMTDCKVSNPVFAYLYKSMSADCKTGYEKRPSFSSFAEDSKDANLL